MWYKWFSWMVAINLEIEISSITNVQPITNITWADVETCSQALWGKK